MYVLAGEAQAGIATFLVGALDLLRPGVRAVAGPPPSVARTLAHLRRGDVVVAVDLRRYEAWVPPAVSLARARGAQVVAITDSVLSPLAEHADATFTVLAEGAGPFDSHVGTLALANALSSAVAGHLRRPAARRLDDVETAWEHLAALTD